MLVVDTSPASEPPETEGRPATDPPPATDAERSVRAATIWFAIWPKLAAVVIVILVWQTLVWVEWKPPYALAPPREAFGELWELTRDGTVFEAIALTMSRAARGFALALVVGVIVGAIVTSSRIVRSAVGALITGLQTMPSIAWFPLAILLFQLSERAILFVVVLGAAPSIANGLITGVDHVPPILLRAGRVLGARGLSSYRHVILPASLPSFVGGLKQGWAFAWRSLMAGELIVVLGSRSVGFLLQEKRNLNDSAGLIAMMIVVLLIGIVVDSVVFGTLDRIIRRRYGLLDDR